MGWIPSLFETLYKGLGDLGQALFPPRCPACGGPMPDRLPAHEAGRGPLDDLVCPACAMTFYPVASPLCPRCGVVFQSREGPDHLCQACLERPRAFVRARAAGIYRGSFKDLVSALKYRGKTRVARPLGRLLFETFCRHWAMDEVDRIVPVPLHRRRFRRRGFNQAFLLVRHWPKMARDAALAPPWQVTRQGLVRSRSTSSQTGLGRRARMKNVRGAFAVPCSGEVLGQNILLVDDVMTTGATAEACARTLASAGAGQVHVLTLARAVDFL